VTNKIFVIFLSLSLSFPAYSKRDSFIDSGLDGTDVSYTTGRVTRDYKHDTFKSTRPFKLPIAEADEHILQPDKLPADLKKAADWAFEYDDQRTQAMLLLDHGHIVYERNSENKDAEFNGWTIAKSITSLLIGEALCKGDIKSLDDQVGAYAPEINGSTYGKATIRQLLTMKSGAPPPDNNLGGGWFGSAEDDFIAITRGLKSRTTLINMFSATPSAGNEFNDDYLNYDALGLVLDNLRGTHFYMAELLSNAGVEHDSNWLEDKDGHINTSYAYGAQLGDWAHIAQYSLDILKGRTNNDCMRRYMLEAVTPSTKQQNIDPNHIYHFYGYGYGMWTHPYTSNGYAWLGMYGQKVWVDPKHDLILIVFRNRNSLKFASNLGNFWAQWRQAHEPKLIPGQELEHQIRGSVQVMPLPSSK
jgi:CubicO group peptidase (beta-lactamase class C family)